MRFTSNTPVPNLPPQVDGASSFATTHWSVVTNAGQQQSPKAAEALETLCRAYWYPLYVFVRRRGNSPEDAQDLTQEFFARLLEKNYIANADRNHGKFRTFLLSSLKNFLINEWKRAGRLKRGKGLEFVSKDASDAEDRYAAESFGELDADAAFERRWAVTLIEKVLAAVRQEYAAAGRAELFAELKCFVWGDKSSASYAELARSLNLTEGNVKVAVHRLRHRFRDLLRSEVAQTVDRAEDVEDELRHLVKAAS